MSAQLAVLAPVLLLVLALLAVSGRAALIDNTLAEVASSAARQASLARSDADALALAETGARTELDRQRLGCAGGPGVAVSAAEEVMRVKVTCRLSATESWLPFERTITSTQTSPRDRWRSTWTG